MTDAPVSTPIETPSDWLAFREKLSPGQILLLIDGIGRAQQRAIERGCNQTVTITINAKGLPRFLSVSDDVEFHT